MKTANAPTTSTRYIVSPVVIVGSSGSCSGDRSRIRAAVIDSGQLPVSQAKGGSAQRNPPPPQADHPEGGSCVGSCGGIGEAAVPASDASGPSPSSPLRPVGAERPGEVGQSAGTVVSVAATA